MMYKRYKKRLVAYLNKENFDYTQASVDPFEYHSVFLMFAKLFSIVDYEKLDWWMYVSPVCVAVSGFLATVICFITAVHSVQTLKVHLITECGTYLIMMINKLLIISCTFRDRKHYHSIMRALAFDFDYIRTKGLKYRDRYFSNQKFTFKWCALACTFTAAIGIGMTSSTFFALFTYYVTDDAKGEGRPLPFPIWLFGYDLQATPVYEILLVLSVLFTFFHAYMYSFSILTQVLWVREIASKADIVIWSIQDLLVDVQPAKNKEESDYYEQLIRHRMRDIISMHQSMFDLMLEYAAVYKKCLLFEQKVASPLMCMTAYSFAQKLDVGEFHGILVLLGIAIVVIIFIPSYMCTFLLEKVQSVSYACWDIPFWNAGPVVRPYLVLIMQRSMRQLPLVAAGFEDISLQTYSKIISRAYSCFNMLRQANFNFNE